MGRYDVAGIFPQRQYKKEFDNDLIIVDWLTQYSEEKDATYVRGFLGRMLFAGDDGVKKKYVFFPVVKKCGVCYPNS